jgi:hypothetical protein
VWAVATVSELVRLISSEFRAALVVQFIEPVRTALRSITIALAWAILTPRSVQTGTPARAKVSIPLPRSHGVVLSTISLISTPRCLAWDQGLDDPGAARQGISIYEDLAFGAVNRFG